MATTPVDPRVIAKMQGYLGLSGVFGNASAITHVFGQAAYKAVEEAREQIAKVIGASCDEIIFTSGATESNQLAIFGASRLYQRKGKHIITMQTEHPSVLGPMQQLEREGFTVSYLPPREDGTLDIELFKKSLRQDTIFVSIMHVNNETGVIQDITKISECLKDKGILFHVDAAQSVGKIKVNVEDLGVHLLTLSGHKNYGPKGVGALYIRAKPRVRILPISFGGDQERGLRPGTLATHQIVGMAEAFFLGNESLIDEAARILVLRNRLYLGLLELGGVHLNGHKDTRIPGNLNISVDGIEGSDLLPALAPLAVSSASACAASTNHPSYVLKAMGLSDARCNSALRFSLGRFTNEEDVIAAIKICKEAFALLRRNKC
ncbi:MAG: IscS subfamily cysteine desulfurase [Legionellales bacterium RIFCSPHIGHO2_12_FULL_37_14]|nr:MAG: IscS subfamily cysteine desulfurase [Legionellales bacterium RIFCSPHIGHO2_12_FULL_37_14]